MFTRMMAQGIVTIIYTLEFAGLLVAALPRYKQKYYVPVKMLCSVSFVVIAVMFAIGSVCGRRSLYGAIPDQEQAQAYAGRHDCLSSGTYGIFDLLLPYRCKAHMVEHLLAGRIAGSLLLCEASDASAHGKTGDSGSDILRLSVAHAIQEHTIYGTLPGTCFRLDRLWRYRLFYLRFYDHLFVLLQVP